MKHCTLIGFVTVILALTGCETQADRDEQKNAQLRFQTARQEAVNQATDRLQASEVELVNQTQGDVASMKLSMCFKAGYDLPRRVNLDGGARPIGLSNRRIAECDVIMKELERDKARLDAQEKAKDAAYDKAHPTM
jgi:hypothetical protein